MTFGFRASVQQMCQWRATHLWCVVVFLAGAGWLGFSGWRAMTEAAIDKDIHRRWVSGQYLLAGVNPYRVGLELLERAYPEYRQQAKAGRAPHIYVIPRTIGHPDIIPKLGPPESTYPPPTLLWQALVLGALPDAWVNGCWTVLNILLVMLLAWLLSGDLHTPGERVSRFLLIGGLLMLWAPLETTVANTQYGILVVTLLYLGYRLDGRGRPVLAGVCWAFALIKPSLSLPFLILPLVEGRWRMLGTLVLIHGISLGAVCVRLGVGPIAVTGQWLELAGYFTSGMYTLHEFLDRLGLGNSSVGYAAMIALLVLVAWLVWRRGTGERLGVFLVLCLISVFWTHHNVYDFVPLVLIVVFVGLSREMGFFWPRWWWLAGFWCLNVAFLEPVATGDTAPTRVLRWVGRLVLVAMVLTAMLRLAARAPERRGSAGDSAVPG